MMKPDQERVRSLLTDAVTMLCKNGLDYQVEMRVEGLIGITLDNSDIVLVHLNEKFNEPTEDVPISNTNSNATIPQNNKGRSKHSSSRKSSQPVKRVKLAAESVDLTEEDEDETSAIHVQATSTPIHPYKKSRTPSTEVITEVPQQPPETDTAMNEEISVKNELGENLSEANPPLQDPPHDAVSMGEVYSNLVSEYRNASDPPDKKPMLITLPGDESSAMDQQDDSMAEPNLPINIMPGVTWHTDNSEGSFSDHNLEQWQASESFQGSMRPEMGSWIPPPSSRRARRDDPNKKFKCLFCGRPFHHSHHLRRHERDAHSLRRVKINGTDTYAPLSKE